MFRNKKIISAVTMFISTFALFLFDNFSETTKRSQFYNKYFMNNSFKFKRRSKFLSKCIK